MYVTAIVLAAGKSLRFSHLNSFRVRGGPPTYISKMIESGKTKISKPLVGLNHKPIIIYCLNSFSNHPYIRDIIVVVNYLNRKGIINKIRQYRIKKIKEIVLGGRRRQDSVINGLKVMDARTDLVLVHDAGRPFVDKKVVSSVIKEAKRYGAAIVGVPVKATIKSVVLRPSSVVRSTMVEKTLDREKLWEIQTPQVFKKDLILEAYREFGNTDVTDDASLVERLGRKVRIVMGSCLNIKITTPEDLISAEAILKVQNLRHKL